jgi:transcription antitermination factor NusG
MLALVASESSLVDPATAARRFGWYAVHCRGNPEMGTIPHLREQGLEVYCPMVMERRRVPRSKLSQKERALTTAAGVVKPVRVQMIPGIVFARRPDGGSIDYALDHDKILGLVCVGEEPLRVPATGDNSIAWLRSREVNGVIALKVSDSLIVGKGDKVRIVDGSLTTMEGTVEQIGEQDHQHVDFTTPLSILVQMFGGTTRVRARLSQVEKI